MKYFKLFLILFLFPSILFAQDDTLEPSDIDTQNYPFDFTLQLKNNHLWRGLEVSPEVTLATDMHIKDKSNTFKFGLWGGAGITGEFKEFDYYFSVSKAGFTLAVWDIYNFSPGVGHNNSKVFNYVADETGHFIDVSLAYRIPKVFPLGVSWSTVVFGRDRGELNDKNRYSSYVAMDYPIVRHSKVNVDLGIAGAFALSKNKDADGNKVDNHFYGKSAGIVNINVVFSKTLKLGSYKLPVSAMAMWNPENNYANIQLAFNLF